MDCAPCPALYYDWWEHDEEVKPTLWMRYAYDEICCIVPKFTVASGDLARLSVMDDQKLTLADIWVDDTSSRTTDTGIRYTCDGWTVHITCQAGNIFQFPPLMTPNNLPCMITGRGVTETWLIVSERLGESKEAALELFDPADFKAYCAREAMASKSYQLEIARNSRMYSQEGGQDPGPNQGFKWKWMEWTTTST
ncbi:hypothetical protein BU15DRAFT_72076 [Melanogaster broomeanus]|nr:hypothetical protein BU15DRAFT_72076 [Melanogaster broomeanus]